MPDHDEIGAITKTGGLKDRQVAAKVKSDGGLARSRSGHLAGIDVRCAFAVARFEVSRVASERQFYSSAPSDEEKGQTKRKRVRTFYGELWRNSLVPLGPEIPGRLALGRILALRFDCVNHGRRIHNTLVRFYPRKNDPCPNVRWCPPRNGAWAFSTRLGITSGPTRMTKHKTISTARTKRREKTNLSEAVAENN